MHIGPIDGHDMGHLLPVVKNLRDPADHGPVLVHVVTEKGEVATPLPAHLSKNTMRYQNSMLSPVPSTNRPVTFRLTRQSLRRA